MTPLHLHSIWYVCRNFDELPKTKAQLINQLGAEKSLSLFEASLDLGLELGWIKCVNKKYDTTDRGKEISLQHWRYLSPKTALEVATYSKYKLNSLVLSDNQIKNGPKILDLFCGVGGLGLGFERAGFKVTAAIDNDPEAIEAHEANFPDCVSVLGDVNVVAADPYGYLKKHAMPTEFDGIIGGPPCQGFSNIGERVVEDDRNFLTTQFARIINELKPKFFVLENVPGLKTIGKKKAFVDFLIENSGPIALYATLLTDSLPTPQIREIKRERQHRRKTISALIRSVNDELIATQDQLTYDFDKDCRHTRSLFDHTLSRINDIDASSAVDEWLQSIRPIITSQKDTIDKLCIGLTLKAWVQFGMGKPEIASLISSYTSGYPNSLLGQLKQVHDDAPDVSKYRGVEIGPVLRSLMKRFEKNYDLQIPTTLTATDFGCPQSRQRLFIIGFRKDLSVHFNFPTPTHVTNTADLINTLTPTCFDAMSDLPDVDDFDHLIDSDKLGIDCLNEPTGQLQRHARMLDIPEWSFEVPREGYNPFLLSACRRTIHAKHVVERLEKTKQGIQDKTSGKTRLKKDGYSVTLRAGTREGKGSHTAVRPVHYEFNRVITVREGARLMGFPDWFQLHHTKWHGFRLVGNAVPSAFGFNLGSAIKNSLRD